MHTLCHREEERNRPKLCETRMTPGCDMSGTRRPVVLFLISLCTFVKWSSTLSPGGRYSTFFASICLRCPFRCVTRREKGGKSQAVNGSDEEGNSSGESEEPANAKSSAPRKRRSRSADGKLLFNGLCDAACASSLIHR